MARYAMVVGGSVANVIESDAAFASALAAQMGATAVVSAVASPGDDHAGGVFTKAAGQAPTPDVVTKYQFIEALEEVLSITADQVDTAIAAMPPGRPKRRMAAWWRTAWVVARASQSMNAFQALMGGLTNTQIRNVFRAAEAVGD